MATVFDIMSYGGMALAVICLALAVVLFVKWNIPKVFGDITGRTEKKTIERIRQEGYEVNASKKISIKPSGVSGKIKARKTDSEELIGEVRDGSESNAAPSDEKNTGQESAVTREENITTTVLQVYDSTEGTVVSEDTEAEKETTMLSGTSIGEETAVLNGASGEEATTVLSGALGEEETTVLSSQKKNGEGIQSPEELTTILAENSVEGVINLPDEIITQPGTVAKVLDFIVTHTEDVIS